MLTLHYHPGNASLAPHIVLEELGQPFALEWVDRANNQHQSAAYLQLNPNGQIPVLQDGALVVFEAAAICLHLADTHAQAALAPAMGTPARAHFYQWLMWMTNTLQAALMHYFYPERLVDSDNPDGARQVKAHAQAKVTQCLMQLDTHLARQTGPWMLGQAYSALDPYALMLCRWTRGFDNQPARSYPHIGPYLQRMLARSAVQRAFATEALLPPLV
jgi:glutathione S-transferase